MTARALQALRVLAELDRGEGVHLQDFARAMWPDSTATSQGRGRAAGGWLAKLQQQGVVREHYLGEIGGWAWRLTAAGRRHLEAA